MSGELESQDYQPDEREWKERWSAAAKAGNAAELQLLSTEYLILFDKSFDEHAHDLARFLNEAIQEQALLRSPQLSAILIVTDGCWNEMPKHEKEMMKSWLISQMGCVTDFAVPALVAEWIVTGEDIVKNGSDLLALAERIPFNNDVVYMLRKHVALHFPQLSDGLNGILAAAWDSPWSATMGRLRTLFDSGADPRHSGDNEF